MIKIKNVSLSFPDIKLYENLSLEIKPGENVCISGDSGKGKSTFLKMLQGYIIPNSGEISIDDIPLNHHTIKDIREMITWIPQNVNLPVNNGAELLQLMHLENNKEVVLEIMAKLGLGPEFFTKDFTQISGGQKQRVIIAICLSINSKIVLMDEPTSSLDNNSINKLIETVNGYKDRTIVSASHNDLWLEKAERVVSL